MADSVLDHTRDKSAVEEDSLYYLGNKKCPECGSTSLIVDNESAEIVCENCGFVVESLINRKQEWRAFNLEERQKRARTGAPLTYTVHDKGLSTEIDWRNRDAYGKNLPMGRNAVMHRLRRWHHRTRVSENKQRNLTSALFIASKIADKLSLPRNILETSSLMYRKALKKEVTRGRSIEAVTVATLYLACRQCGLNIRLKKFAEASGVDEREIGRAYRFLVKELGLHVPPINASHYVSKFSNALNIDGRVEPLAYQILQVAGRHRLTSGKGPAGIAAATVYIASTVMGDRITEREVAETAEVSQVTVRNRYKDITRFILIVVSL